MAGNRMLARIDPRGCRYFATQRVPPRWLLQVDAEKWAGGGGCVAMAGNIGKMAAGGEGFELGDVVHQAFETEY